MGYPHRALRVSGEPEQNQKLNFTPKRTVRKVWNALSMPYAVFLRCGFAALFTYASNCGTMPFVRM